MMTSPTIYGAKEVNRYCVTVMVVNVVRFEGYSIVYTFVAYTLSRSTLGLSPPAPCAKRQLQNTTRIDIHPIMLSPNTASLLLR